MTGLTVALLGGFDARASGASVRLPIRKAQALLAYLSVRPGQRHHCDKLAALLWSDRGDSQARECAAYHAAAIVHLHKGDWEWAREATERQIAIARVADIVDVLPRALGYSAPALAFLGERDEAVRRILESARLLANQVDAERAETHYRRALALAEPRGLRPVVAHCHLGLGRGHTRLDKPREALAYLATAAAMYREMDMTYWRGEAAAAMANGGRPASSVGVGSMNHPRPAAS